MRGSVPGPGITTLAEGRPPRHPRPRHLNKGISLLVLFCFVSFRFWQGKGVGSARKKLDASILEDRDKPYACDSECLASGRVVPALDPAPARDLRGGRVIFLLRVVTKA